MADRDGKMSGELAPCPFCGERRAIVKRSGRWGYFVSCACAAVGPNGASRKEAVERWNARVATVPVQGRLPI